MGSLVQTTGRVGRGVAFLPAGLLTNGEYVSLVTGWGAGGSFWRGDALTRFRPDRTTDTDGIFFFLRDRGGVRSLTRLPAGDGIERDRVTWQPGQFTIESVAGEIESRIEMCVAPGQPLELRRAHLRNLSETPRLLDLSAYLEVVLQRAAADASHPAFSKLFVETAFDTAHVALAARRRPRDRGEKHPWLAAALRGVGRLDFDTDRALLWERGHFASLPAALSSGAALAGSTGDVLDPAFCLRRRFELGPGASETFTLALAAGESRDEVIDALRVARRPDQVESIFLSACDHEQDLLDRFDLDDDRAEALQALWISLRYGLARPKGGPSGGGARARYGAPGDDFYVYFHVRRADHARRAQELVCTHEYWRAKGLASTLILVHEPGIEPVRATDGCFVWPASQVSTEDRAALEAHAAWIAEEKGSSFELRFDDIDLEEPRPVAPRGPSWTAPDKLLDAFNGYGGFTVGGAEYVVRLPATESGGLRLPPQPWVNVIAREDLGFLVSETGSISTWGRNSRERRLT